MKMTQLIIIALIFVGLAGNSQAQELTPSKEHTISTTEVYSPFVDQHNQ